MSAIESIEDEPRLQEFVNLAFELLGAVDGKEEEIHDLLDNNKTDQAFQEVQFRREDTEDKLKRMYELSRELHNDYPEVMDELEQEIRTPHRG